MSVWAPVTNGAEPVVERVAFDPVELVLHATGPMFVLVWLLVLAGAVVWAIAVLKTLQVGRLSRAEDRFEEALTGLDIRGLDLHDEAVTERLGRASAGARVLAELLRARGRVEPLEAVAERALLRESRRLDSLMTLLSTVASVSPMLGLLGTVYGIMEAFFVVGATKSANLIYIGPAIGEALLTTAMGLGAAIPAVVLHNAFTKRIERLLDRVTASSRGWVKTLGAPPTPAPSRRPVRAMEDWELGPASLRSA